MIEMKCAAPIDQQSTRDLQLLPTLVDGVEWVEAKDLDSTRLPLVVGALWLSEEATLAERVLRTRTRSGRTTVVVPRFRGGDLAAVLGTPSAITIRAGEGKAVMWNDGEEFKVSSVSQVDTVLHAGRWARTEQGTAVFSYRPHAAAGAIVLCTANVTSRATGVDRAEQARLLGRILTECGAGAAAPTAGGQRHAPASDSADFLRIEGPRAAALLLALVACEGDRSADLETIARQRLGLVLDPGDARWLLDRLPEAGLDAIQAALIAAGWGAHLRLLHSWSPAS